MRISIIFVNLSTLLIHLFNCTKYIEMGHFSSPWCPLQLLMESATNLVNYLFGCGFINAGDDGCWTWQPVLFESSA